MNNSNNSKPFICNIFPADTSGCNAWRNYFPMLTIEALNRDIIFNVNRRFIVDQSFFNGVNLNICQRQVSTAQAHYFNNFIIPVSKTKGGWVVYNIDDCIHKDDIPKYNAAWDAYQSDELMSNIKSMMDNSDFILVTTTELKEYYNTRFNIPTNKIIVIPNYIPKWWMGDMYDKQSLLKLYRKHRSRPRIGIISSASHYDINNKQIKDDSTELAEFIRATHTKYQWVVFGSVIPSIIDLLQNRSVEFYEPTDIYHYPQALKKLNLQAIVAPLIDNTFNRCKSNIKLLEGWAIGVPVIAQNLPTYSKYTDSVFANNDELAEQLDKTVGNEYRFENIIEANYNKMEPWWLENNIDEWLYLYKLRAKPIVFSFDHFMDTQKSKQTNEIIIEK
jgi:hypothetical protein